MDILKQLESAVNNPFVTDNPWKSVLDICQHQKADNSVFPYRKEIATLAGSIDNMNYADNTVVFSDESMITFSDMTACS